MAYYIVPDHQPVEVKPADGVEFTLEEMQRYVAGYIEIIGTTHPKFLMVVNEEGRLKNLPFNEAATRMAASYLLGSDRIVGPCLIGTRKEMGAES